jgi:hypothetical protein
LGGFANCILRRIIGKKAVTPGLFFWLAQCPVGCRLQPTNDFQFRPINKWSRVFFTFMPSLGNFSRSAFKKA